VEMVFIKKIERLVFTVIIILLISFVVIKYIETLPSRKFCMAVRQNDINTINELLYTNWNVNAYSNLSVFPIAELNVRYLPLNEACLFSNSEIVEKLLKKGADPNKKHHSNPAYYAVQRIHHNGCLDTKIKIELLIKYGLDLTLLDGYYQPVRELIDNLIYVKNTKEKEIVVEILKLMLNNGAVYDVEDLRRALIKADMDWAFEYLMESRTPIDID